MLYKVNLYNIILQYSVHPILGGITQDSVLSPLLNSLITSDFPGVHLVLGCEIHWRNSYSTSSWQLLSYLINLTTLFAASTWMEHNLEMIDKKTLKNYSAAEINRQYFIISSQLYVSLDTWRESHVTASDTSDWCLYQVLTSSSLDFWFNEVFKYQSNTSFIKEVIMPNK